MNYSHSGLIKRWWLSLTYLVLLGCLCFTSVALAGELGQVSTASSLVPIASESRESQASLIPVAPFSSESQTPNSLTAATDTKKSEESESSAFSSSEYQDSSYNLADNACGDLGYLPQYENKKLTDAEDRGRCTWYLWTGDGDEALYRTLTIQTHGKIDLLKALDSRTHDQRFAQMGLINDPSCKKAEKPDQYGLWLDECKNPYSAGVIGARKYLNPNFEPRAPVQ